MDYTTWRHAFKLDPAKTITDKEIKRLAESGTDGIIVGGSDGVTMDNVLDLLIRMKRYAVPLALEVSTIESVMPGFDYYFIPTILNSTDTKWVKDLHHEAIKEYGTDALRFALSTGTSPGNDMKLANNRLESSRNFANKIWNASRFALMNMDGMKYEEIDLSGEKSVADAWILTRLNETIESVTSLSDRYEFGEMGRALYNFIWEDFCNWYIEMAKLPLYGEDEAAKKMTRSVLAHVLDHTMRLLHPLMPFITEEIWQNLPHEGESITVAKWPEVDAAMMDKSRSSDMKLLVDIIKAVRNIRAEVNTPMSKPIKLLIRAKDEKVLNQLEKNEAYLDRFCHPETLEIGTTIQVPEKAMSAVVTGAELFLPLEGLLNLDEEIARLEKELAKWTKEVERVENKLSNERFVSKAPQAIVDEEKAKKTDYEAKQEAVKKRIEELRNV